jgi:hypothetical protein
VAMVFRLRRVKRAFFIGLRFKNNTKGAQLGTLCVIHSL